MNWKIVALSEPITGQTIVIDRDMVIGRHQQADIVLQASHISRRHAALLLKEEGRQLWIQDLGSSNGTFVNQQQITERQLKHLDQINFETICFQVVAELATTQSNAPTLEKVIPSDEGMPTLEQRSADVQVNRDGMPENVGIPKPAPIPEHVDVTAPPEPIITPEPENQVQQVEQEKTNTKVGLISAVIIIVILLILAALFL